MASRMITIPVGESLPVGEVIELRIVGRVIGVAQSIDAPGWMEANLEISDPAVAATSEGLDVIMDRWHQPRPATRVEPRLQGADM